jgi:hypothetical protein
MMHCPVPHLTSFGQDAVPVHLMSQLDACVQSTIPRHDPEPQVMRQGTPGGHTTPRRQADVDEQSTTQVAPTQVPVAQALRHAVAPASDVASEEIASLGICASRAPDSDGAPPVAAPSPPRDPPELASNALPSVLPPPEPALPSTGAPPAAVSAAASRWLRPPLPRLDDTSASGSYPMRPHAVNIKSESKTRRFIRMETAKVSAAVYG